MRVHLTSAAGVLALAVLMAGCSSGEEADGTAGTSTAASPSAPSPSGSTGAGSSVDAQENGSADAGGGLEALANPVATVQAKTGMEEDPDGSVKVDVLALKRKDKLLIMTAAVTPRNSLAEPQSLFTVLGKHSWFPTLVDTKNLKLYSVVRSGGSRLSSKDLGVKAASGQPMFVYAVFAAPPADVTSINVQFADGIPALNDVPVQ
jgi:hypothetical protein